MVPRAESTEELDFNSGQDADAVGESKRDSPRPNRARSGRASQRPRPDRNISPIWESTQVTVWPKSAKQAKNGSRRNREFFQKIPVRKRLQQASGAKIQ